MQRAASHRGLDLLAMALVFGLLGGLLEGAIHMVVQRFVPENVWYEIIWIAAVFNGILLAVVAGAAGLLTRLHTGPKGLTLAIFTIVLAASLPCIALGLRAWTHPSAILILAVGISAAATRAIVRNGEGFFRSCRRALPAAIGLTILAVVGIEGGFALRERIATRQLPPSPAGSPDVLLLIIDTLRADHLSVYGYPEATSAGLDRLARQGVTFEHAFSTSSYTLPSHVSMLTGLSPREHDAEWLDSRAWSATDRPTLPEVMRDAGYRTGAFSGNTVFVTREHGFGRGFLHFEDFFHSVPDMVLRTAYGRMATRLLYPVFRWKDLPGRKRAPETNHALVEWLTADADRPAFAMVNYFDLHDPYMPSRTFSGGEPAGRLNLWHGAPERLSDTELLAEIDAYDGAIREVDMYITDLLRQLSERRRRDLIVFVTSDHGEEFGEHGDYGHGNHLYREAVHVPLIVRGAGRVPEGTRVATPVSVASIPATIADLAGIGRAFADAEPSLRPLWGAEPPSAWPAARADLPQRSWDAHGGRSQHGTARSLVTSNWHFIHHSAFGPELYDFVRDARERQNLAHDAEHRVLVSELSGRLERPRDGIYSR